MITKTIAIINPMAGNSHPEVIQEKLQKRFAEADQVLEIREIAPEERLSDVVHQALERGFDRVIAVGGDGTVSGVVDGLVGSGVPLGIIPTGTGNIFARVLDLPTDVEQGIGLFFGQHTTRMIDALQVGDRFFILNVGVGLNAHVMQDTDASAKRQVGFLAYFLNGTKRLIGLELRRFTLKLNGKTTRLRANDILVVNPQTIGVSFLEFGANVHHRAGQMEIFALRPRFILDFFRIAWGVLTGRQRKEFRGRFVYAGKQVLIDADRPLPVQGDGDFIGETPVEVNFVPGIVKVITAPTEGRT